MPITSIDTLPYRIRAQDPPTQHFCLLCGTPWGFSKSNNGLTESPVVLPCGCIAGSSCLEQAFKENGPQCPLCRNNNNNSTISAPLHPRSTNSQLELRMGINDWVLPSIESALDEPGVERMEGEIRDKLDVLNGCHGTFLSVRELEICIAFVDFRLGATTSVMDVLDAFFQCPLLDDEVTRCKVRKEAEVRDALGLINRRAGTSFLVRELEVVISLMNHVHGCKLGVLDVLGLRDGDLTDALRDLENAFQGVRL